mmetsp:Transcript_42787/g.101570  ORF Transcript_42787/g.101570 Transcript_42787/m.101570 type:complete len:212 (+) Transcript_42787:858-1493(+)
MGPDAERRRPPGGGGWLRARFQGRPRHRGGVEGYLRRRGAGWDGGGGRGHVSGGGGCLAARSPNAPDRTGQRARRAEGRTILPVASARRRPPGGAAPVPSAGGGCHARDPIPSPPLLPPHSRRRLGRSPRAPSPAACGAPFPPLPPRPGALGAAPSLPPPSREPWRGRGRAAPMRQHRSTVSTDLHPQIPWRCRGGGPRLIRFPFSSFVLP